MTHDPNRPYGQSELARLAQEGQARAHAALQVRDRSANSDADLNLRIALGPVRGAPARRAVLVLLVLCVMGLITVEVIAKLGNDGPFWMFEARFLNLFVIFGLFSLYMVMTPLASRAGVEAERAWVGSLPFALEGYFEVIAAKPNRECRLRVELWWTTQGVDLRTLQGVIALFDIESAVIQAGGNYASFMTGPISGTTAIGSHGHRVVRNHRLGKAVHRLVTVVLMPVHRNAPLARVKLSRS